MVDIEKVKQAIRDTFKENDNQPLTLKELILLIDQKLSNGEIVDNLADSAVKQMLDDFELFQLPDDNLALTQHS